MFGFILVPMEHIETLDNLRPRTPVSTKPMPPVKNNVSSFAHLYVQDESTKSDNATFDHSYSKSWNSQAEQSHALSARYISWINGDKKDLSSQSVMSCVTTLSNSVLFIAFFTP